MPRCEILLWSLLVDNQPDQSRQMPRALHSAVSGPRALYEQGGLGGKVVGKVVGKVAGSLQAVTGTSSCRRRAPEVA